MSTYRTTFQIITDTKAHAEQLKSRIDTFASTHPEFSEVFTGVENEGDDDIWRTEGNFYHDDFGGRTTLKNWVSQVRITNPMKSWIVTGWIISKRWDRKLDITNPLMEWEMVNF